MSDLTHEFVVPAYGRSPHLEACLDSLASQSTRSKLTISTSTPFDELPTLARRYDAELFIHQGQGIASDWNAALSASTQSLVTLAHQDDLYHREFAATVMSSHASHPEAAISFCDFDEIDVRGRSVMTTPHRVKNMLVGMAFHRRATLQGGWRRRLLLGFGNPVICPSVTFSVWTLQGFRFIEGLRTNLDWEAWLRLSDQAPVLHLAERMISRRAHEGSETSLCLADGSRANEDRQVLDSLWPRPIAATIAWMYRLSYRGYLP